ncbi:MAG: hypothetical protein WA103_00970 [Minisyncoccales bacterium]
MERGLLRRVSGKFSSEYYGLKTFHLHFIGGAKTGRFFSALAAVISAGAGGGCLVQAYYVPQDQGLLTAVAVCSGISTIFNLAKIYEMDKI